MGKCFRLDCTAMRANTSVPAADCQWPVQITGNANAEVGFIRIHPIRPSRCDHQGHMQHPSPTKDTGLWNRWPRDGAGRIEIARCRCFVRGACVPMRPCRPFAWQQLEQPRGQISILYVLCTMQYWITPAAAASAAPFAYLGTVLHTQYHSNSTRKSEDDRPGRGRDCLFAHIHGTRSRENVPAIWGREAFPI